MEKAYKKYVSVHVNVVSVILPVNTYVFSPVSRKGNICQFAAQTKSCVFIAEMSKPHWFLSLTGCLFVLSSVSKPESCVLHSNMADKMH